MQKELLWKKFCVSCSFLQTFSPTLNGNDKLATSQSMDLCSDLCRVSCEV